MSLLNPQNPIDIFIRSGKNFLQSPSAGAGIEFDDAVIALKRHSLVQLNDHKLSAMLGKFGSLIREQAIEQLSTLFEETEEYLKKYVS